MIRSRDLLLGGGRIDDPRHAGLMIAEPKHQERLAWEIRGQPLP